MFLLLSELFPGIKFTCLRLCITKVVPEIPGLECNKLCRGEQMVLWNSWTLKNPVPAHTVWLAAPMGFFHPHRSHARHAQRYSTSNGQNWWTRAISSWRGSRNVYFFRTHDLPAERHEARTRGMRHERPLGQKRSRLGGVRRTNYPSRDSSFLRLIVRDGILSKPPNKKLCHPLSRGEHKKSPYET